MIGLLLLVVHGFGDGYYAWNGDQPPSHLNFCCASGTTAEHANELTLNLAAIDIAGDAKPFAFHLSAIGGDGAQVVGTHVYRASIAYRANERLTLEGGVYPSHIGFEAFYSKDNWNYTRGWLGELSPYYQTGLKAHYAFDNHWSGELHLLDGWQTIGAKLGSGGTQIAWSGDRFSASFNTFIGGGRRFGDLVALYKTTPKLSLGGSLDRGHQGGADWLGLGAYARYALDERHAVAVRAERFRDPDNGISGAAQTLTEGTVTYEYRPASHLILKLEARRDHSTASVFSGSRNETLVVGGAVVTF